MLVRGAVAGVLDDLGAGVEGGVQHVHAQPAAPVDDLERAVTDPVEPPALAQVAGAQRPADACTETEAAAPHLEALVHGWMLYVDGPDGGEHELVRAEIGRASC